MSEELENRLISLEGQVGKYKKTAFVAMIVSILCGGGGLVSLGMWLTDLPKIQEEVTKLGHENQLLELNTIRDSLELTTVRLQQFQRKHDVEVGSIARQLSLNKDLGNQEEVLQLTELLIAKETQFQELIAAVSDMCMGLAKRADAQEWAQQYLVEMHRLKESSQHNQQELRAIGH